jgi:hypothetical protein
MVRQYAHLSADHLAPYADRLCALRSVDDVSGIVPLDGPFCGTKPEVMKGCITANP